MKKHFLLILISFLLIFTFCSPKEAEVKIKAGVVMASGDVKNVARQEFLITKTDLVEQWLISKKQYWKDFKLIEDEIKEEMDYDKKTSTLENDLNKYRKLISKKTNSGSPEVKKIHRELTYILYMNIYTAKFLSTFPGMQEKAEKLGQLFEDFQNKYDYETRYEPSYKKAKEWRDKCKIILEELIKRSSPKILYKDQKEKDTWQSNLKKLKEINNLINNLEAKLKEYRANILKITNEINKLKEELRSRSDGQFELHKNKAINDFQIKLKGNIVKSFKTNLNGEASLTIKKREYFLFGITHVGQNNIIWNLPVNIEEKEHYFELSNDNAFAIDDVTLASELLEALEGFK